MYLTVWDPMDCSLPGSSVCGISPGKNTGVVCHFLLHGIFPTEGSNLCLLHGQVGSLPLSHQRRPKDKVVKNSERCIGGFISSTYYTILEGAERGKHDSNQFSCHSVVSNSLWPHGLHHARLPCPSASLGACSDSCPSSQQCRLDGHDLNIRR